MTSGRRGIEHYTPERIDTLAKEAVRRPCSSSGRNRGGEMEVVLAPKLASCCLAIRHGVGGLQPRKFHVRDKMGKPVSGEPVNRGRRHEPEPHRLAQRG
jgi:hypothetical protein